MVKLNDMQRGFISIKYFNLLGFHKYLISIELLEFNFYKITFIKKNVHPKNIRKTFNEAVKFLIQFLYFSFN